MSDTGNRQRLTWDDIRDFTPLLFRHDEHARPPQVARRLWAAVSAWGLNEYDSDVDRSSAKSLLMTVSLIFQEFRALVWRHSPLMCPNTLADYLRIPPEHIAKILHENRVVPESEGNSLNDIMVIDLMNRDAVAHAITNHFGSRDSVFRVLAFPTGLSREQRQMSLGDLLTQLSEQHLEGNSPNWKAGFDFIDNNFERKFTYSA